MSTPQLAVTGSRPSVKAVGRISPPVILILLTILTRVPLQSHRLYLWDSVNFAFALQHFDVAQGQPQAPGYLCYVLLGRVAAAITGSAESGFVLLAILGSALASWAIYDLGTRLWNPRVGWFASLLLISSPLFWFYGEIALPHTLDALMVIVAANLSWRVWNGENRMTPWLALWLGLAGGLREQTLVFMLPLALVASLRSTWKMFLIGVMILSATTIAWLVPLLEKSGGWTAYWAMVGAYSKTFDDPTSVFLGAGWHGLHHNLSKLFRYTLWAWSFGLIPLLLGAKILRQSRAQPWIKNRRVQLFALWAAPSLFFYVFIHMGQQGLIFVFLPICFLLSGRAADALARKWTGGTGILAACALGNALLYILAPTYLLPPHLFKVDSESTLRAQDHKIDGEIAAVTDGSPPGSVLLASDWRFPQYYLPKTPLVALTALTATDDSESTQAGAPPLPAYQDAPALVWYEPALDKEDHDMAQTTVLPAVEGLQLRVLHRPPGQQFWITSNGFGLIPAPAPLKADSPARKPAPRNEPAPAHGGRQGSPPA
jgi:hypothetical protein